MHRPATAPALRANSAAPAPRNSGPGSAVAAARVVVVRAEVAPQRTRTAAAGPPSQERHACSSNALEEKPACESMERRRYQLKYASPNNSTAPFDQFDQQYPFASEAGTEPSRFRALRVRKVRGHTGLADDRRGARLPGLAADAQRGLSRLHRPRAIPAVRRAAAARRADRRPLRPAVDHRSGVRTRADSRRGAARVHVDGAVRGDPVVLHCRVVRRGHAVSGRRRGRPWCPTSCPGSCCPAPSPSTRCCSPSPPSLARRSPGSR